MLLAASLVLVSVSEGRAAPPSASGVPSSAPKTFAERQEEEGRKREATLLLNQGLLLLKQSEFADALTRFLQAYDLYPSAKLLLNIGTSLRYLNRHSDAAEIYERYLAAPDAAPERIREVERILDGIDHEVAWVVIEPSLPAARVTVDGEPILPRRDQLRVRLDPGSHVLVAEATGEWLPKVMTIEVGAGERRTVPLVLERKPRPLVVKDGTTQRFVGWSVGGFGVAALGAGGVVGLLAVGTNASAAEHCAMEVLCDAEGAQLGARAAREALASTIAFAVGGAAVTAGAVLLLTAPSAVAPRPAPSSAPASGTTTHARTPRFEATLAPTGASLRFRWWTGASFPARHPDAPMSRLLREVLRLDARVPSPPSLAASRRGGGVARPGARPWRWGG